MTTVLNFLQVFKGDVFSDASLLQGKSENSVEGILASSSPGDKTASFADLLLSSAGNPGGLNKESLFGSLEGISNNELLVSSLEKASNSELLAGSSGEVFISELLSGSSEKTVNSELLSGSSEKTVNSELLSGSSDEAVKSESLIPSFNINTVNNRDFNEIPEISPEADNLSENFLSLNLSESLEELEEKSNVADLLKEISHKDNISIDKILSFLKDKNISLPDISLLDDESISFFQECYKLLKNEDVAAGNDLLISRDLVKLSPSGFLEADQSLPDISKEALEKNNIGNKYTDLFKNKDISSTDFDLAKIDITLEKFVSSIPGDKEEFDSEKNLLTDLSYILPYIPVSRNTEPLKNILYTDFDKITSVDINEDDFSFLESLDNASGVFSYKDFNDDLYSFVPENSLKEDFSEINLKDSDLLFRDLGYLLRDDLKVSSLPLEAEGYDNTSSENIFIKDFNFNGRALNSVSDNALLANAANLSQFSSSRNSDNNITDYDSVDISVSAFLNSDPELRKSGADNNKNSQEYFNEDELIDSFISKDIRKDVDFRGLLNTETEGISENNNSEAGSDIKNNYFSLEAPLEKQYVLKSDIFDNNLALKDAKNIIEQVTERILSVKSDGKKFLSVKLFPEELGVVEIFLDVNSDGKTNNLIVAENRNVLEILKQESGALNDILQDSLKDSQNSLNFSFHDRGSQKWEEFSSEFLSSNDFNIAKNQEDVLPEVKIQEVILNDKNRVDLNI